MQEDEVLKIAIAETSMIVRSGLALVLKRIQGLKILPIELVSEESLDECSRGRDRRRISRTGSVE